MATYAALVSLTSLIDHIQLYHARKPTFTTEQLLLIRSLQEKVTSLQVFLESYDQVEADLERRIADAAYRAEDIIESHIVDDIDARSSKKKKSDNHHLSYLPEVIRSMDSITEEVTKIKKLIGHQPKDLVPVGLARASTMEKDTTVVFDDELNEIMAKLIGQGYNLQMVPITGMGGIGKTTLAKHAYDNSYVVEYFDIRGWITVSQTYDTREILLGLALEIGVHIYSNIEYHQLVEKLYKHLSGRRYLIIIDDMWDIDAWVKLKASFPKNDNGSRIVITTRLSNVANYFGSSDVHQMNLLDDDRGWSLLCRKVFVRECCPLELEEIGKKIAKSCKGLPLSIAVVGGFLAKSKMTQEYWEYVATNMSTAINLGDDERCLKILSLSYNHLPIYLKPCFLYMGVFPEDYKIRVSELIKLWVAEGFLKPNVEKSLEEVAEDYLKDLIGRNLIFVKLGSTGNLKFCSVHDLLRDLCLREAHRESFFCVDMVHNCDSKGLERRFAIHHSVIHEKHCPEYSYALQSASLRRTVLSFTSDSRGPANFKLLRIYSEQSFSENMFFCSKNSRYLTFIDFGIPKQIDCFWNLQTLVIRDYQFGSAAAPSEIWEMPQLRHLMVDSIVLPDPPSGLDGTKDHDDFVLRNLQTLSFIDGLRCTKEVLRRIPNIKKLKIFYVEHDQGLSHYFSDNLEHLHKLQSLECRFMGDWATRTDLLQNLGFSTSLKKLTLWHCGLSWEDMATKIGPLPNLQKLRMWLCFKGEEWCPVEGQFLRLKFLNINSCRLIHWTSEGAHFTCLERLFLSNMVALEEIPLGFADIATLQSVLVQNCKRSVVASAKRIQQELQDLGNEDFRLTLVGEDGSSDGEEEAGEENQETFVGEEVGRGNGEDSKDNEEENDIEVAGGVFSLII